MTNIEAIAAEIEPYSLSDDAYTKALIDACAHFSTALDADEEYAAGSMKTIALAAMSCLNRLRVLAAENNGGISQNYNTAELEEAIKGIAKRAGLSAALVLDDEDGSTPTISYAPIW